MTHTPEPFLEEGERWHADGNYVYRSHPGLPEMIARCPDIDGRPYLERARLIAAAPEMKEALESLVGWMRKWPLDEFGDDTYALDPPSPITIGDVKRALSILDRIKGDE